MRSIGILSGLALLAAAALSQVPSSPFYGTGSWNADSLGNHRVVLRVGEKTDAAFADILWRRRDRHPDHKQVIIVDSASGEQIVNAKWLHIDRERGTAVFQTPSAPGTYFVHYLLYRTKGSSNYPRGFYVPAAETASPEWTAGMTPGRIAGLPRARVVRFESTDDLNTFFPMEVIATAGEMAKLRRAHPAPLLLFPEDRSHSIRMTADLPAHWAATGPSGRYAGVAHQGEYFTFQIGAFASRRRVTIAGVVMDELRDARGHMLKAERFSSFNTSGRDWRGAPFERAIDIDSGHVQALWCGIDIPDNQHPGTYTGKMTIVPEGLPPQKIQLSITVKDTVVPAHGDDIPGNLTRLRWLNSILAQDDSLIQPFTPVMRTADTLRILGRSVVLAPSGLPAAITSTFSPEVTSTGHTPRRVLAAPIVLVVSDSLGNDLRWEDRGLRFTGAGPGVIRWASNAATGPFDVELRGRLECDGFADFEITLTARKAAALRDIRLDIPVDPAAARYAMGLGVKGGYRPRTLDWHWQRSLNQDALWLGDVNAGFQCSFRDSNYERPLNTNFYLSKPLNMPASWENGGKGGIRFVPSPDSVVVLRAYSGERRVRAGERLHYYFSLLLTPFKTISTDRQWATRFYHRYEPVERISAKGANTINVHHATEINPYINYPFLRPAAMKAYVDSAHAIGSRVKIYYTVRELSNRAPEMPMLRSLGTEVLSGGPGGGFSWLQEHLDTNYIAAWFVPELKDAAVINSGISRWHNYYVEGLDWLARNVGIDGLYIDDVAFDRTTMKRVRKTLDRHRPGALIDLHSANQFNPRDGFASSANLYLEHFPYIDRLWFGEYFDYDSRPDYWMVEISGIPFGLMGEMLEKGGNPWRGMVYGMTARLPWAGDPSPIWKAWDDFEMQGSRMVGYWSPDLPVKTGHPDLLATAYIKPGKTLVALASWAPDSLRCDLSMDWRRLGIDPQGATLHAPAIAGFQEERRIRPRGAYADRSGKRLAACGIRAVAYFRSRTIRKPLPAGMVTRSRDANDRCLLEILDGWHRDSCTAIAELLPIHCQRNDLILLPPCSDRNDASLLPTVDRRLHKGIVAFHRTRGIPVPDHQCRIDVHGIPELPEFGGIPGPPRPVGDPVNHSAPRIPRVVQHLPRHSERDA